MVAKTPSVGARTGAGELEMCACKPLGSAAERSSGSMRYRMSARSSRLWLKLSSKPFIQSFVEDLHPGTSRRTRENTRLNQKLAPAPCEQCDTRSSASESSSSSSSSLSAGSSSSRKQVSFHDTVKVFSHKRGLEGEHSIRFTARRVTLPQRLARSRPATVDASAPQSAAGKWLMRRNGST